MLGVDDMKEAIERGLLGGKLTTPKTFKFTDEMLDEMNIVADAYEKDMADWVREVIAEALLVEIAKFNRMARARNKSKCTSDTLGHQKESPVGATTELDVQNFGVNEQ